MQKIETHIVPELSVKSRLSDYAVGIFVAIKTRKGIKKAIKKGLIKINGQVGKSGDYVFGGETISLCEQNLAKKRALIDLSLKVIFEDDFLAIVNKPAGIEVSGNRKWTLENALPKNLLASSQADSLQYPEAIHRLDYPTSGVILIGKTREAVVKLNKMFANKQVSKIYFAVTIGKMQTQGECTEPIDGKISKSTFGVVDSVSSERFEKLNLVKLSPHTGRKHQLRKHMAFIGNPILGDKDYGTEGLILNGNGLYLHAVSLEFEHPFTQEKLFVQTELPKKFTKLFPNYLAE